MLCSFFQKGILCFVFCFFFSFCLYFAFSLCLSCSFHFMYYLERTFEVAGTLSRICGIETPIL